jgi:hypothetical protein
MGYSTVGAALVIGVGVMKINSSLLAPYGSMKFARLATKVGIGAKMPKSVLAPYGSMKFARLTTKVGVPSKSKEEIEKKEEPASA